MTTRLPDLISRYAVHFHQALGEEHHAASPVGAWMLLALVAEAAQGEELEIIEHALGCDAATARSLVNELLAADHPAVTAAAAAWVAEESRGSGIDAWLETLSPEVEQGGVPSQEEADRWAAERTMGLIEKFPLELDDKTALVLASALATKISWSAPFELAAGTELELSQWEVEQVLRSAGNHDSFLHQMPEGEVLAVHVAHAAEGLDVVSVVGPESISMEKVMEVAHEIAASGTTGPRLSLFDLPLGEGHSWEIKEMVEHFRSYNDKVERTESLLPAWSADDMHDLTQDVTLGCAAAGSALVQLLPPRPEGYEFSAKQAVAASYTRTGFEAAAVTAFGVAAASMPPPPTDVTVRSATLKFRRSYAVVAAARQVHWDSILYRQVEGPWHNVPVFSAWVTRADEAVE